jgi:c-di-GMP-binding flagellar brake protein YcgR
MPASIHRLPGRRHPRVPFSSEIAVQVPDWVALRARGLDLSYGGMSLILGQQLAVGDKLFFGLQVPGGRVVRVAAVVRNVLPTDTGRFRVGLEWAELRERERDELRLFVDGIAAVAA